MGNCFFWKTHIVECAPYANPTPTNINPGGPGSTNFVPRSITDPLQKILVWTKDEFDEDVLRVTFDDNSTRNQWAFHEGGGNAHITELFRTPSSGGQMVEIVGYPPPFYPQVKWCLTVSENTQGVPDRFPRFLPETNGVNPQLHTQFTVEEDGTGRTAFSFTTNHQGIKYYLVPSMESGVQYIETKETNDPELVFQTLSLNNTTTTTTSILTISPINPGNGDDGVTMVMEEGEETKQFPVKE